MNHNEENPLPHLIKQMDPNCEGELNSIEHSNYFGNKEFLKAHHQINGKISILNLNCKCIKSNFDKIKLFLEYINNNDMPVNVITVQEHGLLIKQQLTISIYQIIKWYTMIFV